MPQINASRVAQSLRIRPPAIAIQSSRDALVKGSTIVADGDVRLQAGRDLTITTAENREAGQSGVKIGRAHV